MPGSKRIKKHRKSKKKKWVSMAIYRTALNPEQAVLSCCLQVAKPLVYTPMSIQCVGGCGRGEGTTETSS